MATAVCRRREPDVNPAGRERTPLLCKQTCNNRRKGGGQASKCSHSFSSLKTVPTIVGIFGQPSGVAQGGPRAPNMFSLGANEICTRPAGGRIYNGRGRSRRRSPRACVSARLSNDVRVSHLPAWELLLLPFLLVVLLRVFAIGNPSEDAPRRRENVYPQCLVVYRLSK